MLQNLLYFYNKKTRIVFFRFSFRATLCVNLNECPGLYRHRPGHSLGKHKGKHIKLHEMKNEKTYVGFLIIKI